MNKILGLCVLATAAVLTACNPQQAQVPAAASTPAATPAGAATAPATAQAEYKVVNWGQQTTGVGKPFNVQADGNSGISFELNQPAPAGEIRATFDGKPLTGIVANGVIVTATIPADYLATAGKFPVALVIPNAAAPVAAGDFEVK